MAAKVLNNLMDLNKRLTEVIELFKPLTVLNNQRELWDPVKIDIAAMTFMEKYRDITSKFPEMFPLFNARIFSHEFNIVKELYSLKNNAEKLSTDINKVLLEKGNDALNKTMMYHKTLTNASRRDLPGARILLEDANKKNPYRKNRKPRQE